MSREVKVVRPDGLKARVVTFEREEDREVETRESVRRTEEEIEWARFQVRWKKWVRQFGDPRSADPSHIHGQVWG